MKELVTIKIQTFKYLNLITHIFHKCAYYEIHYNIIFCKGKNDTFTNSIILFVSRKLCKIHCRFSLTQNHMRTQTQSQLQNNRNIYYFFERRFSKIEICPSLYRTLRYDIIFLSM